MKKLNKLFASIALSLMFSVSAFAGDGVIIIGKADPTPTPTSVVTQSVTTNSDGVIIIGLTSADQVMETALSVLQSVLALF